MENEILQKVTEQDAKIDKILTSVEKTRKYFLITMWFTILVFVLPLLASIFIIPQMMSTYMSSFQGLL